MTLGHKFLVILSEVLERIIFMFSIEFISNILKLFELVSFIRNYHHINAERKRINIPENFTSFKRKNSYFLILIDFVHFDLNDYYYKIFLYITLIF